MSSTFDAFAIVQGLLGARAFARMLATGAGDPIPAVVGDGPGPSRARASAIVPVLDEERRVGPALAGLCRQPASLTEILVVDGGSRDGTRELVRAFAQDDARVKLIDAGAAPAGWNGKAWNLACGLAATDPASTWVLTLDADVRPAPNLVPSLLAFAEFAWLDAFSAAPRFEVSSALERAVHPALLATLVYRFGLPGNVATSARDVQANGQCFFARRRVLVESGAIERARASRCEDVTIARELVRRGARVGFFEAAGLARVRMYDSAADCLRNWPRSLALRDTRTTRASFAAGIAELALVQALPLWLALAAVVARRTDSLFFRVNAALALARFGVLAGTRRAYLQPGATFWLAPLADVPALVALARAGASERAVWRGRELVA